VLLRTDGDAGHSPVCVARGVSEFGGRTSGLNRGNLARTRYAGKSPRWIPQTVGRLP